MTGLRKINWIKNDKFNWFHHIDTNWQNKAYKCPYCQKQFDIITDTKSEIKVLKSLKEQRDEK